MRVSCFLNFVRPTYRPLRTELHELHELKRMSLTTTFFLRRVTQGKIVQWVHFFLKCAPCRRLYEYVIISELSAEIFFYLPKTVEPRICNSGFRRVSVSITNKNQKLLKGACRTDSWEYVGFFFKNRTTTLSAETSISLKRPNFQVRKVPKIDFSK